MNESSKKSWIRKNLNQWLMIVFFRKFILTRTPNHTVFASRKTSDSYSNVNFDMTQWQNIHVVIYDLWSYTCSYHLFNHLSHIIRKIHKNVYHDSDKLYALSLLFSHVTHFASVMTSLFKWVIQNSKGVITNSLLSYVQDQRKSSTMFRIKNSLDYN